MGCTWLAAKKILLMAKKRKTSKGPRKLKSGYWQEADDEDDIDIFEWIAGEELEDEPPASLSGPREVAAFATEEGVPKPFRYMAPEYRTPERRLQLQKAIKRPPPLDQDWERRFAADVAEAVSLYGREGASLAEADVVTSLSALRMLIGFVDGTMVEDFRAKGLNTRRRNEPELVDLMRIGRMAEAPKAIVLATVWNWVPSNATAGTGALNRMSYDVTYERAATGLPMLGGPPSTRDYDVPMNYRILEYDIGGLRMAVKVPVAARVPSVDRDDVEGYGVQMHSVNRRDVGDLWGRNLATRYADMLLGDVGMVSRGVVDKGTLVDFQEVTRDDLRLDRPSVVAEAERLLGRLVGLINRVREVADCPGCQGRRLYLQYSDEELRVISPIPDGEALGDLDDDGGDDKGLDEDIMSVSFLSSAKF